MLWEAWRLLQITWSVDGRGARAQRDNMIKTEEERLYYRVLGRVRRLIETRVSQLKEYGLRYVRAVTRKGLAIKIITSILTLNIYQLMEAI